LGVSASNALKHVVSMITLLVAWRPPKHHSHRKKANRH